MRSLLAEIGEDVTDQQPPRWRGRHQHNGAYTIHHPDGTVYVGSSGDLYTRRIQHLVMLKNGTHHNRTLQAAYDREPHVNFQFSVTPDRETAFDIEQKVLDRFRGDPDLANTSFDARVAGKGCVRSPEMNERNRQAHLGKKIGAEHRVQATALFHETAAERERPVEINGLPFDSVKIAAEYLDVPKTTVFNRVNATSEQFANWRYL
jgi:hypothetical protein